MDLRWAFKPDNWDELSPEQKLTDIFRRMDLIFMYEKRKMWRDRFASPEQLEDEYPEGHEKTLAIAFIALKEEFDPNVALTMKLNDNNKYYVKWLSEFIEQDVERVLLEGEEDEC